MINQDIYLDPPQLRKLENQGVANVNDDTRDADALKVLLYELKTFVCDGQYEKGIQDILDTYLRNINKPEQPGVWVSGFFGSGKSHMVKMLRALWVNTELPDGATAREVARLPQSIRDLLVDLSNTGKREGGLHAASGTLGASATGSVRLALLEIIFKSVGLPQHYPVARFVLWLQSEGILDQVRSVIERQGYDWQEELDNFYVAEGLHAALVEVKPNLFGSTQICVETLNNKYPHVTDVSNDQMIAAIRDALTRDGKFPLTLVVLDEVQQFISNADRSFEVQEMTEACCKRIGGKLMLVGTGQTAVTGTANLKRLEGRFTTRIELSDADVESVIRQVILAKKPEAISVLEREMEINIGEIAQHLQGSGLAHRGEDREVFAADYPILPVRRRFWEAALRVLDQTGTDSQLRNQLSMAHKVIQTNLDKPVPHVIAADYLYFDAAEKLLQARVLPRKVYEQTMRWIDGSPQQQLLSRACGLIFLVNKVAAANEELGIKATADTIADLMVEDLHVGSGELRAKLPGLLDQCDLLIRVGSEYRIQTEESAAWTDEFLSQRNQLANAPHRIDAEREDRIRARFGQLVPKRTIQHGQSRVSRNLLPCFDSKPPADAEKHVTVWVRDEWSCDLGTVQIDARQAGIHSPTIFVFLPKRSADDLRHHMVDAMAAKATLDKRGVPTGSADGMEARSAMETTQRSAEQRMTQLLDESFHGARVIQGGGNEVLGNNLEEMILEAAEHSLARLYPNFAIGDALGWDKVYKKAKEGAPDALLAVGYEGEPEKHPVCKQLLSYIAAGKKGIDLRSHFAEPPFGWDRDAVDGAIQVLLVAGVIRGSDEHGKLVDPRNIERKAIGKLTFRIESANVTAPQRIQIRKLFQQLGLQVKANDELAAVPAFLESLAGLAATAGGPPPKPAPPETSLLSDIRLTSGNEQLLLIYNRREQLKAAIDQWKAAAKQIDSRWPAWTQLQTLLQHAGSIQEADEARQQAEAIAAQRLLLANPDPITPLVKSIEETLRRQVQAKHDTFRQRLARCSDELDGDTAWQQLGDDQRQAIRRQCDIDGAGELRVGTQQELVDTLKSHPIAAWDDRTDALTSRFARAREQAAKLLQPEAKSVEIPRRTLNDVAQADAWIKEVESIVKQALAAGPIILK